MLHVSYMVIIIIMLMLYMSIAPHGMRMTMICKLLWSSYIVLGGFCILLTNSKLYLVFSVPRTK